MHYHLGLICANCLDYFTTSTDAMYWHAQLCKPTAASDDDREEEDYEDNDNGNEDDEFLFEEDLTHPINSTLNCSCILAVSIL